MNNKTKNITLVAMFCAIAYVMVAIGRVPVVLFLKYDPKDIVITICGLILGPLSGFFVSFIVSVIEMFTLSSEGIVGCIMNIISTCSFACTTAYIYKKKRTLSGAVIGLLLGSVAMVGIMILWNYLITPMYMGVPRSAVVDLLLPAFLPFNALKAGLNAAFTFLLYRPVVTALRKAGYVGVSSKQSQKKTSFGLLLVALLIAVTCILFILSFQGII